MFYNIRFKINYDLINIFIIILGFHKYDTINIIFSVMYVLLTVNFIKYAHQIQGVVNHLLYVFEIHYTKRTLPHLYLFQTLVWMFAQHSLPHIRGNYKFLKFQIQCFKLVFLLKMTYELVFLLKMTTTKQEFF